MHKLSEIGFRALRRNFLVNERLSRWPFSEDKRVWNFYEGQ